MSDLEGRAAELAALIPALAAALTRDTAPGDGGRPALSAGVPFNTDVLGAGLMLSREVPAAYAAACELAGERWQHRPLDTCLRALPRLHARLSGTGQRGAARRIEGQAERWARVVKLALGLRKPDTAIGACCPLHDEPCPLVMIGSEAFVRDGGTGIAWNCDGRIWCRQCGETWQPWQWPLLEKMLAAS